MFTAMKPDEWNHVVIIDEYIPIGVKSDILDDDILSDLNESLLKVVRVDFSRDHSKMPLSDFQELGAWHSQSQMYQSADYIDIEDIIQGYDSFISPNMSFTDTRTANIMKPLVNTENQLRLKDNKTKNITFPSWLYRCIAPNLSQTVAQQSDRVFIGFNFNQFLN